MAQFSLICAWKMKVFFFLKSELNIHGISYYVSHKEGLR